MGGCILVRYLLYKGGYFLMPLKVIEALYVIDKYESISQTALIFNIRNFSKSKIKTNSLSVYRDEFLELNNLYEPQEEMEVLQFLRKMGLIHGDEDNIQINYECDIERSVFKLSHNLKDVLYSVRNAFEANYTVDDIIDRCNIAYIHEHIQEYKNSEFAYALLQNKKPIHSVAMRTTYLHEMSLLGKLRQSL